MNWFNYESGWLHLGIKTVDPRPYSPELVSHCIPPTHHNNYITFALIAKLTYISLFNMVQIVAFLLAAATIASVVAVPVPKGVTQPVHDPINHFPKPPDHLDSPPPKPLPAFTQMITKNTKRWVYGQHYFSFCIWLGYLYHSGRNSRKHWVGYAREVWTLPSIWVSLFSPWSDCFLKSNLETVNTVCGTFYS